MSESPLRHFAEAYMHQDLDLDYGDIPGAAAAFVAYPLHDAEDFLRELQELLARARGDAGLHRELERLTAQYLPQKAGELRRQLEASVEVLQQAVVRKRLFVVALTEVLRSWNRGPEAQELVVQELAPDAAAALAHGLRQLLPWNEGRPDFLVREVQRLTGESPPASPEEARRRLTSALRTVEPRL